MRLTGKRYEEIKEAVYELFETYGIDSFPLYIIDLIKKMGIHLVRYSDLDYFTRKEALQESHDAFSVLKINKEGEPEYFIYYEDLNRRVRRRNWTLLHEVGHIWLGHLDAGDYKIKPEVAEAEADFFAKTAIAPYFLVDRLPDITPESIARKFCVSREASEYLYTGYLTWKRHTEFYGYSQTDIAFLTLFHMLPGDENDLEMEEEKVLIQPSQMYLV